MEKKIWKKLLIYQQFCDILTVDMKSTQCVFLGQKRRYATMEYGRLMELLFQNRGYDADLLDKISLYDRNEVFLNVDDLCDRLLGYRARQERVVFVPDYDMDGIMSGVIGFAGLVELGFQASLYIPEPHRGYGFDKEDVDDILSQYPDTKAILTADTGITCFSGVEYAKSKGLAVMVTDHHHQAATLPDADVVVDPMQKADPFSFPEVCGAYVIYCCLLKVAERLGNRNQIDQIRRLRMFAGIGTIADSMPVISSNRELVKDAIAIARLLYSNGNTFVVDSIKGTAAYRRVFYGFHQVLTFYKEAGKLNEPSDIDEGFFGFYVTPMFNSVKRLGRIGDMSRVFGVFFKDDPTEDIDYLIQLNDQRKEMVNRYMVNIELSDQPFAPYLYLTDAPLGIAGLLATKLMDATAGPCMVGRIDVDDDGNCVFHGSGRSPEWFPFLKLNPAPDLLGALGHEGAYGFVMELDDEALWKDSCETYVKLLEERLQSSKTASQDVIARALVPDFVIADDGTGDTDIDILEFMEFVSEAERMKPFGRGFPEPNILLKFRAGDGEWKTMGSMQQHLKISLPHGLDVICWNQAEKVEQADDPTKECQVWGKLSVNEFHQSVTVQFLGDLAS